MDAVMEAEEKSQILVERAREGDRPAFDELVKRYRGRIAGHIKARLGGYLRSRVDVDDLLQEVLLRAFSSLSQFHWSGDQAFFRWLGTIARNVVHEVARREQRELILPSEDVLEAREISPRHALERGERFDRLEKAIERLTPEHREVILMARIRRLPIQEVAARMNRTPDAIAQLLRRALKKLKSEFGDTESLSLPDRSLLDDREPAGG
jgi:RNA polymerase sigma-70 factor (ECF subfamily)